MAKRIDITGSIGLVSEGPFHYGDEVSFTTHVSGRMSSKSRIYVQVIGTQNSKIVYQWSAEPSFVFPLVQQDGLAAVGAIFDPTQPADFVASLIYREDGSQTVIKSLDEVAFVTVQP